MKSTREEVYKAIDSERDYQDKLSVVKNWNPEERIPAKSTGDYLTLLSVYLRYSQEAWNNHAGDEEALHIIRKIAGIAVHCMEDNGAYKRRIIDDI